ncbi:GIY-YIG nuclease family protein [Candidatus Peribacteria bacterium]|nr:GIY-YIG nuclease family protein [Candidatus Peribacteria bacterium]
MHYVYILESADHEHWYVGVTDNLERRITEYNNAKSPHTSKIAQWRLKTYTAFPDRVRAEEFEHYLKSHSGRAFTKKHL